MAKIEHFRYWCQKVLPLVYDDSLSYYELLGKVIKFLNDVVDAVNENTDDVASMRSELTEFEGAIHTEVGDFKTYINGKVQELETYMNNYFNNLDVQNEINAKLDAMAQDGTLTALITPLVPDIVATWLSEHITPTTPAIDNTLSVSGAGADAKVVGDLFKETIHLQTSIDTDLDDYTNVGYYLLDTAVNYTHSPIGNNTRRTLLVFKRSGVYCQIMFGTSASDATVDTIYIRHYADNTWGDWHNLYSYTFQDRNVSTITSNDLDNATAVGSYVLTNSVNYSNCPVGINNRRVLLVYKHSGVVAQYLYAGSGVNRIFVRWYASNSWGDWFELYDFAMKGNDTSTITDNDLNNATRVGYYVLSYSTSYTNSPITGSERKVLWVTTSGSQIQQIMYTFEKTQLIYSRFYTSGSGWSKWKEVSVKSDDVMVSNIVNSEAHITHETAGELSIMTYNVANWNKDTSTYINDDRIQNVRRMLNENYCDIVCCQEDKEYIDNSSKKPLDYIFRHALSKLGSTTATVYSSISHTSQVALDMAGDNNRVVRLMYYMINNKKVAVLNLHATSHVGDTDHASPENVAQRLVEYTSVHNFVNGTGTLKNHSTQEDVSFANDVDYTIICGDFNTITVDDRTNIQTVFSDMKLLNGGWLGWMKTVPESEFTCDNIIVSSNVGIKEVHVLDSWYDKLYSDHVPMFARLTLN